MEENIACNVLPPLERNFAPWSNVLVAALRGDGPRELVTRYGVIQRV